MPRDLKLAMFFFTGTFLLLRILLLFPNFTDDGPCGNNMYQGKPVQSYTNRPVVCEGNSQAPDQ